MPARSASTGTGSPASGPPSPDGGWSQEIVTLQDAVVVPPAASALTQECGVVDRAGRFCPFSATWRGSRALIVAPQEPAEPVVSLSGRHLYGGQLWYHFGHFLVETISRLWALDEIGDKLESIVFIPKRPAKSHALKSYQREFFELLGIDLPVRILDAPTRVEKLVVPGQGFGLGDIAAGTDKFRAYMAGSFAPGIQADGPERLYLSRSRLGGQEGGIVLEDALESNLEASGYTVYHPQTETIDQQIARYRAAQSVVGPDGSAFHLFGFVAKPAQRAAVVLRRNSNVFLGLDRQIRHFAGIEPVLVDAVVSDWIPDHKSRPGRYSFGQLDFGRARDVLARNGFIDPDAPWQIPRFRQVKRAMEERAKRKGQRFVRVKSNRSGDSAADRDTATRPADKRPARSGGLNITAVTCVKNEGPFLLEWIAFNRVIGVTDFLFYSNDCDDGTDVLLDALARHGIVRHLPNPAEGRNYQMEALKDAAHQDIVRDADWTWIADVDEFLNIHAGDGTIPELISACGEVQAISVNFQFFANGGVLEFEDRPVISQFLHSHNPDIWCDQLAIEVKTLVRKDFPLKYFGAHRPFFRKSMPQTRYPRWSDGSGRAVPHKFLVAANKRRIRRYPAQGAREFATLNHYALRSLDSYLVKNARGDVNREHRNFDDTYWRERNDGAFFDDSILRYLPRLEAEIEALKALDGVAGLHEACVASHREKIATLLANPTYVSLRKELSGAPTIPPVELKTIETLARGLPAL